MTDNTLQGINVMLCGPTGSGKTHSIRTLIDHGITPFVISTEPIRTLAEIPEPLIHWHYIPMASPTWDMMIDTATKINTLSFEAMTKLAHVNKQGYGQWKEVLYACANFTCDKCGNSFGDVTTWPTNRALVLDGLSGVSIMSMDLVVGSKPVKSPGDWNIAMDNIERFVNKLCADTRCHFVLVSHLEREMDEVTGMVKLMPSTLGRKLAPKLGRFFDDVIMTEREGTKFTWSTGTMNVDLKARNLPYAANLKPDFGPVIESWKAAGGVIEIVK